jgi:hypothetical protein
MKPGLERMMFGAHQQEVNESEIVVSCISIRTFFVCLINSSPKTLNCLIFSVFRW